MARPCHRTRAAGLLNELALPSGALHPCRHWVRLALAWPADPPPAARQGASPDWSRQGDGYSSEKLPIRSSSLADVAEPGALTRGSAMRSMR
jgi:hypothetical protein